MSSAIVHLPKEGAILGNDYRLEERIGRGSFGVVYRATQTSLGRTVAIKVLHPRALADPEVVHRFKREAQLASSLRHRNAVVIHGVGEFDGGGAKLPYMAMELLEGEELAQILRRRKSFNEDEVLFLLDEALSCLSEAHDMGFIHRDLKPENLFVVVEETQQKLKIVDFGIAKAVNGDWAGAAAKQVTRTGMVCGTPEFMAPEQATASKGLTPACDVYAIGCIAYQMLTGRPPYEADSPIDVALAHVSDPVPSLGGKWESTFWAGLITKALQKEPEERWSSAGEMLEQLRMGATSAQLRPHYLRGVGHDNYGPAPFHSASMPPGTLRQPSQEPSGGGNTTRMLIAGVLVALVGLMLAVLALVFVIILKSEEGSAEVQAKEPPAVFAEAPTDSPPPPEAPPKVDKVVTKVVAISSDPVGAAVWSGEELLGRSPLKLELGSDEARTLTLKADGFEPREIQVSGETASDVEVELTKVEEPATSAPEKSGTSKRGSSSRRAKAKKPKKKYDIPLWK